MKADLAHPYDLGVAEPLEQLVVGRELDSILRGLLLQLYVTIVCPAQKKADGLVALHDVDVLAVALLGERNGGCYEEGISGIYGAWSSSFRSGFDRTVCLCVLASALSMRTVRGHLQLLVGWGGCEVR